MITCRYPVDNKKISQGFGFDNTKHPIRYNFYTLFDNKHPGVDFNVPVGTDVFASFEGIVVRCENHVGMGNTLGVRNGNIVALYAHLSEFNVNLGDHIQTHQQIGLSGNTGQATIDPHLHFELRDISYTKLSEMVFDPPFDKEINVYSETFTYTVNNTHTPKTLHSLSLLFFGSMSYSRRIAQVNTIEEEEKTLPHGLALTIPNYI